MNAEKTKEIASADGQYKVVIVRLANGLYEVSSYKWAHEVVPALGEVCEPFWEPISRPSLTDSVDNAEKLANEELLAWSGSK